MILFIFVNLVFCIDITCQIGQTFNFSIGDCAFCQAGYGILKSGRCGLCPQNEGINPITGECGPCSENECINPRNNICILAELINAITDIDTKLCKCSKFNGFNSSGKCSYCQDGYGIDPISNECVDCRINDKGVDPETKKCVKCQNGYKLDIETNQCVSCPYGYTYENSFIQGNKKYCHCPDHYGIDKNKNECVLCDVGYCIDKTSDYCKKIPIGYTVSSDGYCYTCGPKYGINPTTGRCEKYSNPEKGIDPLTKMLINCPNNSYINSDGLCICNYGKEIRDGKCEACLPGYGYNDTYRYCIKCTESQIVKENKCVECNDIGFFNSETKECISCLENECFNFITKKCIQIPQYGSKNKEGFCSCNDEDYYLLDTSECGPCPDGDNKNCVKCPDNRCFDPDTKDCREPLIDEIIDQTTAYCIHCPVGMVVDYDHKTCVSCNFNECIENNKCIKTTNHISDPITKKCICPYQKCFFKIINV